MDHCFPGEEAGVSRSVLAERFRHYLDEAPMVYLTRWRLQLGAQLLGSTSYPVAQIASEVGYESEAALTERSSASSQCLPRVTVATPDRLRRLDRQENTSR